MSDFIGFTYCGLHSFTDLQIVRTSNGSRYNENLLPAFQDVTASVPGRDGQLYWESFYSNKTWNVPIAFDSLTEIKFRALRQAFDAKKEGWLIFDELPFKKYWAKVQTPPQLNYICFDDPETGGRVYKGEGTITFVAYDPYAHSVYKYLEDYSAASYPNKAEWSAASGMLAEKGTYDRTNAQIITVYNAGDIEADWKAYFPISSSGSSLTSLQLKSGNTVIGTMGFSTITRQDSDDTYMCINSRTNLIEGCKKVNGEYVMTGSLYNIFWSTGDFFKIPLGGDYTFNADTACTEVEYEYLYY